MQRWRVLLLLTVGVFIACVDRMSIANAYRSPEFLFQFNVDAEGRFSLDAAFFLAYVLAQLPAGWLIDRIGIRTPLLIGFGVLSCAVASTALATEAWHLVGIRFLMGAGESVLWPCAMAWLRNHAAEEERGLFTGILAAASQLGLVAASALTFRFYAEYGWQQIFVALGVLGVAWLLLWFAVGKTPTPALLKPSVPIFRLLSTSQMWGTLLGMFSSSCFLFYSLTWLPVYFLETRQLSRGSMSIYSLVSFGGSAVVAILAGWGADSLIRAGMGAIDVRKWFTTAGLFFASIQVVAAMTASHKIAIFCAVFSVTGVGLSLGNAWALTQSLIPAAGGGTIAALQNTAVGLAGLAVPVMARALQESAGSTQSLIKVIWLLGLAGIVAYVLLIGKRLTWPADEATRGSATLAR